jgi:signal transduction histidine kinase/CHASE3 domain sensor protein
MRREESVGRLLTRAFAALVLVIVCAGLAEMGTILAQHRVVRELTAHVEPLELANADLRALLADAQRGLRGYLLSGDSGLLATYDTAQDDYPRALRTMRTLAVGGGDTAAIDDQAGRADAWWALADRQRQAQPRSDAAVYFVGVGKPLFEDFVAANAAFDQHLARQVTALQHRSSVLGRASIAALGVLTLLAALFAALTKVRITRRIVQPLELVIGILHGRRQGDRARRADADAGPAEVRALAGAVNAMADESDRIRSADQDIARLRGEIRALGYRIRGHLVVADAQREAVQGLSEALSADHVLLRMAEGQADVPQLTSLHDEHGAGPLAALAVCDIDWLGFGDVWTTDEAVTVGDSSPPVGELQAYAGAAGAGMVLTLAVSVGDERIGALTLIRDGGPPWTPIETRLAEVVAADLGRGVHHARLYERERHLVARLQELDTAKTDFMSTVSHELRTPLTSIAGYLELLLDAEAGELTSPQQRMLEVVGRNTRRLRELIEDMLILSKIEQGGFRTSRRPVDLVTVVRGAVTAIEPAARKASIGLHCDLAETLELSADADQLDRVLSNLLANAVKFTPPEGTVTVTAKRDGDTVILAVADTGMGIPQAEQQALFARFFRASNAIHQAIPGTGLGLAIVRTIVDNHHGQIEVRSTEGAGTTVTVRLPATD